MIVAAIVIVILLIRIIKTEIIVTIITILIIVMLITTPITIYMKMTIMAETAIVISRTQEQEQGPI